LVEAFFLLLSACERVLPVLALFQDRAPRLGFRTIRSKACVPFLGREGLDTRISFAAIQGNESPPGGFGFVTIRDHEGFREHGVFLSWEWAEARPVGG
jgi:hypothetical protein